MANKQSDVLEPRYDGALIRNKFVKAGLFIVKTKTQRNTEIKTLYRELDGSTTTLCYVSADSAIYELVANPSSEGTVDSDWKRLDFGVSDILVAKGLWDADNTTPVLQDDPDAVNNGNDFYVVTGAATPTMVQHAGLFGGAQVTVTDGDWVISNGSEWFVSGAPINWDSISGIPTVIVDYIGGTVIAHPHSISDITGLQVALDTKFDISDVGDHGIAWSTVPDAKLVDAFLLKTNYWDKTESYSITEVDVIIAASNPLTTKGDIITHNGTLPVRKGVGADGEIIIADAAEAEGWKWGANISSGWAVTGTTFLTGATIIDQNNSLLTFKTGELSTSGFVIFGTLDTDVDVNIFRFNHNPSTASAAGLTEVFLGANNGNIAGEAWGNIVLGQNNMTGLLPVAEWQGGRNIVIGYGNAPQFSTPATNMSTHNVILGRKIFDASGGDISYVVAAGYEVATNVTSLQAGVFQQAVIMGIWAFEGTTLDAAADDIITGHDLVVIGTSAFRGGTTMYNHGNSGAERGGITGMTALGTSAFRDATVERYNIGIGDSAFRRAIIGRGNIAVGVLAGADMTGGLAGNTGTGQTIFNTLMGVHTGQFLVGNKNAYYGSEAGSSAVAGNFNAGFGTWSLNRLIGEYNSGFGAYAGFAASPLTGDYNTFVGARASYDIGNLTFDNSMVIGSNFNQLMASNKIYIGSPTQNVIFNGALVQNDLESQVAVINSTTGELEFRDSASIAAVPAGADGDIQYKTGTILDANAALNYDQPRNFLLVATNYSILGSNSVPLASLVTGDDIQLIGAGTGTLAWTLLAGDVFVYDNGGTHRSFANGFVTGTGQTVRIANGAFGVFSSNMWGSANLIEPAFAGNYVYSMVGGASNISRNSYQMVSGANADVLGIGAWVHGSGGTVKNRVDGDWGVLLASNTGAQTAGHGVLADNAAIIGGVDGNIPVGSDRSVILGGNALKMPAATPDTVMINDLLVDGKIWWEDDLRLGVDVLDQAFGTGMVNFSNNIFMGQRAGQLTDFDLGNTFNSDMTVIGADALANAVVHDGFAGIFIGSGAGEGSEFFDYYHIFIGYNAGAGTSVIGRANIVIGTNAFNGALGGQTGLAGNANNIVIGSIAANGFLGGIKNVIMGSESGNSGMEGDYNVILGAWSGREVTGDYNSFLGAYSGFGTNKLTGDHNTMVGAYANTSEATRTVDSVMVIGNSTGAGFRPDAVTGTVYIGSIAHTEIWTDHDGVLYKYKFVDGDILDKSDASILGGGGGGWPLTGTATLTGTVNIEGGGNFLYLGTVANKLAHFFVNTSSEIHMVAAFEAELKAEGDRLLLTAGGGQVEIEGSLGINMQDSGTNVASFTTTNVRLYGNSGAIMTQIEGASKNMSILGGAPASYGTTADGVMYINDGTAPTADPTTGGGDLYSEAGVLKWRSVASGVVDLTAGGGGGWAVTGTTTITGAVVIDNTADVDMTFLGGGTNTLLIGDDLDNYDVVEIYTDTSVNLHGVTLELDFVNLNLGAVQLVGATTTIQGAGINAALNITDHISSSGFFVLNAASAIEGASSQGGAAGAWIYDPNNIYVQGAGLYFIDYRAGAAQVGMEYNADYSANYTDRSLVDKGFADGEYLARTEGLQNVDNTTYYQIQQGVDFSTSVRYIRLDSSNDSLTLGSLDSALANGVSLFMTPSTLVVSKTVGSGFKGIEYAQNNSANFVDRSLIDKGFADSTYWALSGSSIAVTSDVTLNSVDGNIIVGTDSAVNAASRMITAKAGTLYSTSIAAFATTAGIGNAVFAVQADTSDDQATALFKITMSGDTTEVQINSDFTGILVGDDVSDAGMYYGGDYSAAGIGIGDRWIPDWGSVIHNAVGVQTLAGGGTLGFVLPSTASNSIYFGTAQSITSIGIFQVSTGTPERGYAYIYSADDENYGAGSGLYIQDTNDNTSLGFAVNSFMYKTMPNSGGNWDVIHPVLTFAMESFSNSKIENGGGMVIPFKMRNSTAVISDVSEIETAWVDNTNASEDASFTIRAMRGGSLVDILDYDGASTLTLGSAGIAVVGGGGWALTGTTSLTGAATVDIGNLATSLLKFQNTDGTQIIEIGETNVTNHLGYMNISHASSDTFAEYSVLRFDLGFEDPLGLKGGVYFQSASDTVGNTVGLELIRQTADLVDSHSFGISFDNSTNIIKAFEVTAKAENIGNNTEEHTITMSSWKDGAVNNFFVYKTATPSLALANGSALGADALAVGQSSNAIGADSISIGFAGIQASTGGMGLGRYSQTTAQGAMMIGYHTSAQINSVTDTLEMSWDGNRGFKAGDKFGVQITNNSNPASGISQAEAGSMAWDTTDAQVQIYNGSGWNNIWRDGAMELSTDTTIDMLGSTIAFTNENSDTNIVQTMLTFEKLSSGTVAAGFGAAIAFDLQSAGGSSAVRGFWGVFLEDATNNAEYAVHRFSADVNGSATVIGELSSTGLMLGNDAQKIQTAHIQLSQGDIQALATTPIVLVAAQGSGVFIQIIAASAWLNWNGTQYATASSLELQYADVDVAVATTPIIDVNSDIQYPFSSAINTGELGNNKALEITADADATNNGGTIDVYVQYVVIDQFP